MLANARILLVDDHPMFRSGLRAVLEREASLLVEEAATTAEAIAIVEKHPIDLACVDVLVPDAGGPAVARKIQTVRPQCGILGLSMLDEPLRAAEMLRAGASGYALKSQPIAEILAALEVTRPRVRYLAPTLSVERVDALMHERLDVLQRLTIRERRVFDLLVQGNSNRKVAALLDIASSTVETHRRHIMRKLEACSIVDLVHVALRHGEKAEAEFGDLLFSLINYARFMDINPEDALEKTNKKFIKRFQYLERKAKDAGKSLKDMTLAEMDMYWNEAKTL